MDFYIVLVELTKEARKKYGLRGAHFCGYTRKELKERVTNPFNQRKPFWFVGRRVHPNEIDRIQIFPCKVDDPDQIIFPDGKSVREQIDFSYIMECLSRGRVQNVYGNVSEEFLIPLEETPAPIEQPITSSDEKNKIFIVHGTDEASALLLKNHLIKKGINAEMFEDFKEEITGNTTVIEELIKIKDSVGYAFIIATPDDLGNLREDIENPINELVKGKSTVKANDVCDILDKLNYRARQNVIFEYGLFLGVLGREKVQCLWNKKIGEEPSDIEGVLNIQFEKSIRETFSEIDDKLEKLGLIKK